jgi:hypothetical protein
MNFRSDGCTGGCADFAKIVFVLKSDPEFGAGAKISAETKGGVWCDRTVSTDDGRDTAMGNIEIDRQTILGDAQWLKKLGANDFTGVWKFEFWRSGFHIFVWVDLVIIRDLNIMGMSVFPTKADAPLLIDADAELAFAVTF